jgi:hypothetical protein
MRPQGPGVGTERSPRAGIIAAEPDGTIVEVTQAAPRSAVSRRFGHPDQASRATLSERAVLDLLRRPEAAPGAGGDPTSADGASRVVARPATSPYGAHHAATDVLADEAELAAPRRLTVWQVALLGVAFYFAALAAVDAHHRYREWQVINVPAPLDERSAIA